MKQRGRPGAGGGARPAGADPRRADDGLDPIVSRTVERGGAVAGGGGEVRAVLDAHARRRRRRSASRIGVIGRGRVLAEGTIAELCSRTGAVRSAGARFSR